MPFDLPASAKSRTDLAVWSKALNGRDFQDKQLRVIQYGARLVGYYLLKSNPKDETGLKLFNLYKALSLARKAFRSFTPIAHAHNAYVHLQGVLKDPSDVIKALGLIQWSTFSVHILFDNLVFLSHPSVMVVDRPKSVWLNATAIKESMVNWRAFSDLFSVTGLLIKWIRAKAKRDLLKKSLPLSTGQGDRELVAAENAVIDSWYAMVKVVADIATYFPQSTFGQKLGWHTKNGWHDGYIGFVGIIAAVCSMRSEWLKMK